MSSDPPLHGASLAVVELRLDDESAGLLRDAWLALEAFDIANGLVESGARPHVSLVVGSGVDTASAVERLEGRFRGSECFPVEFPYLGVFRGDPCVGYLGVAQTQRLLQLHAAVHETLRDLFRDLRPHFLPENIVLHTTLGLSIPRERLDSYWRIVADLRLPASGTVQGIDVVEYFPARVRGSVTFRG